MLQGCNAIGVAAHYLKLPGGGGGGGGDGIVHNLALYCRHY